MQPIEFRSPLDIERIRYLEEQVKILTEKNKMADKDIKRLLIHDYEVVCEFCAHNGCCYTLNGYDCKERSYWRGRYE